MAQRRGPAFAPAARPGGPRRRPVAAARASLGRVVAGVAPQPTGDRARLPDRLRPASVRRAGSGLGLRASEITSASSATASRSPELGQPREAERVEPVAGQQGEVGIVGGHHAPAP